MTDESRISDEDVRALGELGVATVYEASGIDCALDASIRPAWPGARVCGRAFTVRCHPGDNLPIHRAFEHASAGDVLVVQAGGNLAGYWGEILTVAAETKGIVGLVIDGGVRDTEALARHGFGVFSRGIAVFRTVKNVTGDLGIPLVLGGVPVEPGDVVVGDGDGVLALPKAAVARTLQAARARDEKERGIMERIRNGELTLDIYGFRR